MSARVLPTYSQPPVVETILSAQFDRLPKLANAHLGAFWERLGGEWSTVVDAPPVEPRFERFSEGDRWRELGIRLRVSPASLSRLQAKNADENRMIQVQNGRFLLNWLGSRGESYPRFERVREEFFRHFEAFKTFLNSKHLGPVELNQWEVTYLNHIPRGDLWNSPEDWTFFLPFGKSVEIPGLTRFESFSGEWHYELPEKKGRLHIAWQHGKRSDELPPAEVIVLNLTARGPVEERDDDVSSLIAGFELGREAIVSMFPRLMSKTANQSWGLQENVDD